MSTIPAVAAPELTPMLEEIATTLLASAAASISWAGISTAFRVFEVDVQVLDDANGGGLRVRFNNDIATNYDVQNLQADGTTLSASRAAGTGQIVVNSVDANTVHTSHLVIAKQQASDEALVLASSALVATNLRHYRVAGIWKNTVDLINRIDLIDGTANFAAETFAILRGDRSS